MTAEEYVVKRIEDLEKEVATLKAELEDRVTAYNNLLAISKEKRAKLAKLEQTIEKYGDPVEEDPSNTGALHLNLYKPYMGYASDEDVETFKDFKFLHSFFPKIKPEVEEEKEDEPDLFERSAEEIVEDLTDDDVKEKKDEEAETEKKEE